MGGRLPAFGRPDKGRRATASGSPELRRQCWHLQRGALRTTDGPEGGRTPSPPKSSPRSLQAALRVYTPLG